MPPEFVPPDGTRFPRSGDEFKAFSLPVPFRDRLSFADILRYHAPASGTFTLLRTVEEEIAGAICFLLGEHDVFVDYVMRNERLLARQTPVGSTLVGAVELFAEAHSRPFLRLDAAKRRGLVEWYVAQGFAVEGPSHDDPGWGPVVPMFKPVERGASEDF